MKPIFKRILSGVLSAVMTVSAVPITSVRAEESVKPYPYTMFAASSDEGAITVNASNFCVNGNIATNGTNFLDGNFWSGLLYERWNGYENTLANLINLRKVLAHCE